MRLNKRSSKDMILVTAEVKNRGNLLDSGSLGGRIKCRWAEWWLAQVVNGKSRFNYVHYCDGSSPETYWSRGGTHLVSNHY